MQQLEEWPLSRFVEYPNNPRKNDAAVDRFAENIARFGFRVPILAKSDGTLIDGHFRLKAARKLNLETVLVLPADDMTDLDIQAFRISVNQMANLADWDMELLKVEMEELKALDFDIDLLGFGDDFLGDLFNENTEGLTDKDEVPEPPQIPITAVGDVWHLGNHRLKLE